MKSTPDAVCNEYDARATITVRVLDGDEDTILIEADRQGLEFLGKLFLAQSEAGDCGFQIGPFGAGKRFFGEGSTKGFYIHRTHSEASEPAGEK